MEDKSFELNEWKIDLDLESLMEYTGCKDLGLVIEGIYLSEVALAVYIFCTLSAFETDKIKECLSRLLRFLYGGAEELGIILPVLCLIDVPKEVEAKFKVIKDKFNQLAADQDWHRGDFSIVVLEGDKDKDESIFKILGEPSATWPEIELKPRDIKAIISSFQSEMKSMRISEEYVGLLNAIKQILDKGTDEPVQKWLNERKEDVHNLLGGKDNCEG
jgi:hypothetical protein